MQSETVVVDREPYLLAKMIEGENGVLLTDVRISHVLEPTDPYYMEWSDYRGQFCFTIEKEEEFEDEDWMMGGGVHRTGRAFVACPGTMVNHYCLHGRVAGEVLNTGV